MICWMTNCILCVFVVIVYLQVHIHLFRLCQFKLVLLLSEKLVTFGKQKEALRSGESNPGRPEILNHYTTSDYSIFNSMIDQGHSICPTHICSNSTIH